MYGKVKWMATSERANLFEIFFPFHWIYEFYCRFLFRLYEFSFLKSIIEFLISKFSKIVSERNIDYL